MKVLLLVLLFAIGAVAEEKSATERAAIVLEHVCGSNVSSELYLLSWAKQTGAPENVLHAPAAERFELLSAWYLESLKKQHDEVLINQESLRHADREIKAFQQAQAKARQDLKALDDAWRKKAQERADELKQLLRARDDK